MKTVSQDLKRELFVRRYLSTLNITEAYKQAEFSPNDANANRYFHREDVQELLQKHASKTLQKLDININKTIKHLAAIAYGNALYVRFRPIVGICISLCAQQTSTCFADQNASAY